MSKPASTVSAAPQRPSVKSAQAVQGLPSLVPGHLECVDAYRAPIDALIAMAARRAGGDTALIWSKGNASFEDLDKAATHCASWLSAWFEKTVDRPIFSERIGIYCKKDPGAILLILAALRAGAIIVPLNPALKADQYLHIAGNCSMAAAFVPQHLHKDLAESGTYWADHRQPAGGQPVFDDIATWAALPDAEMTPAAIDPDETAILFYTSGSTGQPKGVMVPHHANVLGAASVAHYLQLSRTDRVLALLPLSFDYGFNQLVSTWAAGGAVVLHDFFLPGDVIKAAARHGVTGVAAVPPLWHLLMDAAWPSEAAKTIRYVTNSGGKLTPDLQAKLKSSLPGTHIYAMYGLTEAFRSTYMQPSALSAKPSAMGKAIPFADVFIVDETGAPCSVGETGELLHAGPLVSKGYWNDAERTARRFKPVPSALRDKVDPQYHGRCVYSGDYAYADADGDLHFVGRQDDMIKVLGNRLSPQEVEDSACRHADVGHAVAFGLDDARIGAQICLVVETGSNAPNSLVSDLLALMRIHLPSYALPHFVLVQETFPHSPNGKLDRPTIKAWARNELAKGRGQI